MDKILIFTQEQGVFMVKLIIAHIICDFIIVYKEFPEKNKFISLRTLLHISAVFTLTSLFTGWYLSALIISVVHFLIEGASTFFNKKYTDAKQQLLLIFICKQALHLLTLIIVWVFNFDILSVTLKAILLPITNYQLSLIIMGYLIVIGPIGLLIKYLLDTMATNQNSSSNENGGKRIGIFERIIILTLVLLGQYEAIGFLITGKSIIRFAGNDEHLKSEYVLVGTMSSYAFSILVGVGIKWLLSVV